MTTAVATDPREVHCFTNVVVRIPDELKVLDDNETVEAGHRCWRIMSKHDGDKRVVWDSTSIGQIAEAKKLFAKLKAEGMVAYRVGTDGKMSSEEMTEFDPHAEEVIFVQMKHVVGG